MPSLASGSKHTVVLSCCLVAVLLSFAWGAVEAWAEGASTRPNIVLCILDDMDHDLFGFRGHPDARTPTLDRLARRGTVVSTCYMQSRCAPSLASILTGRLAHEHGRYFNYDVTGLNRSIDPTLTFVRRLKDQGEYRTYAGGKWWAGFGTIEEAGFDEGETGGSNNENFVRLDQQAHLFDWLESLEADRPFFIWWAPLLPHAPHNPPQRFLDLFEIDSVSVPDCVDGGQRDEYRADQHAYLATIAWVDDEIRRLMEKVREVGRRDNTLFVVVVDNGWSYDCKPSKGFYNRAGWESPVILTFPTRIPAREIRDHLARAADIFPTLLDYAGITFDAVSGLSLRTIIDDPGAPWRSHVVDLTYPASSLVDSAFSEAYGVLVRTKSWSYGRALKEITSFQNFTNGIVHFYTAFPSRLAGEEEMYRLLVDPGETTDLAGSPAVRDQQALALLRQAANDWLGAVGFPLP